VVLIVQADGYDLGRHNRRQELDLFERVALPGAMELPEYLPLCRLDMVAFHDPEKLFPFMEKPRYLHGVPLTPKVALWPKESLAKPPPSAAV